MSGDTTAGGLRRLDWLLRQKPDVVVVGLGGNDGLRGVELRDSEEQPPPDHHAKPATPARTSCSWAC